MAEQRDDRTIIIIAITLVGVAALLGAVALGGLVVWRLEAGEDLQPGVSGFLLALVAIAGGVGAYLAPSPLSKTSGSEPTPVTGVGGGPVETIVTDESGQSAIGWLFIGALAAVVLLALLNEIDL